MPNGRTAPATPQMERIHELMMELSELFQFLEIPNIKITNKEGVASKVYITEWNAAINKWDITKVATLNTGQFYATRLTTASVDPSQHVGKYLLLRAEQSSTNLIQSFSGTDFFIYKTLTRNFPWNSSDILYIGTHANYLSPLGPNWQDNVFFLPQA